MQCVIGHYVLLQGVFVSSSKLKLFRDVLFEIHLKFWPLYTSMIGWQKSNKFMSLALEYRQYYYSSKKSTVRYTDF